MAQPKVCMTPTSLRQKRALQLQVHHERADVMFDSDSGMRLKALKGQADLARQLNNIQWLKTVSRDADTL